MKSIIPIVMITLLLASGFIIYFYNWADDGVKILNDDDYEEIKYSNPTYKDGSEIIWEDSNKVLVKKAISKNEYNKIFSDYRDGLISKDEASQKLRSSEW